MESDGLNVKRQFPKIKDTCFIVKCKISYFLRCQTPGIFLYRTSYKTRMSSLESRKNTKAEKGAGS